ncbi:MULTISPECIES: hypothetical protein [unclassified Streptomyces]|uniref:hypothetical protein n=1 Tax=unclassified Streptomyces TaxID=2593676 RepID=UPI0016556E00|nr:hypothetical protein [Streptomyces sp. CB02980]MCB8902264.1 hypothetical protein [Streptomyces sp. CB02980]
MSRRHHFHIDHLGHSVSATVQTGHRSVVEILVDGKETGHAAIKDDGPVTVPVELPTEPPTTVTVRASTGPGEPRCLLLATADGEPQVMAPRPY